MHIIPTVFFYCPKSKMEILELINCFFFCTAVLSQPSALGLVRVAVSSVGDYKAVLERPSGGG